MKDRILLVRKNAKLNQEDFAKKIGLTKNYISLMETGGRTPSDRTILDICRIFSVNEAWLRDGIEPMKKSKDAIFSEIISDIEDSDDEFIKALIEVYCELDSDSKKALQKIAIGMAEKYKKQD